MNRLPRPLAALAIFFLFAICGAAVAAKPPEDVEQITTTLPELNPGETAWVATLWRAPSEDATSFELTVVQPIPNGISVSYPENTGSFSSLYKQSTLLAGDTDYSSIKLQVGPSVVGAQQIKLNVEYQIAGKKQKQKVDVTLPVVEFSGPGRRAVDGAPSARSRPSSAEYVDVSYKANKPGVTDARLTATPPGGTTVSYPNDGLLQRPRRRLDAVGRRNRPRELQDRHRHAHPRQLRGRARPGLRKRAASPRNRRLDRQLMRRVLVISALAALAAGCALSRSSSLDPKTATEYVDAQAHALCVVQTTAFPTQAEQKAAYEQAQQASKPDVGRVRRGPGCGREGPGAARPRQRPRRRALRLTSKPDAFVLRTGFSAALWSRSCFRRR